jgi:hypothetical protein
VYILNSLPIFPIYCASPFKTYCFLLCKLQN